ncbi:hypothetical protein ACFRQM_32790 [Streptomyces sp. NPDC056831]|uniref:hypothetical protein n=1 Tax=Streptomyces sp. NPDC056831 TaxID=3345954 RepID=UPI0036CC2B96
MLGANSDWSHKAVRSLVHRRDYVSGAERRHERDDPSPGWLDCPDHPNLLPAIDQWGSIGRYGSMHASSLSVLIQTMTAVIQSTFAPPPVAKTVPTPPTRRIAPEEEAAIFARAVNARGAEILEQYG